ncbi:MAG: hypothetical protein WD334_00455, partial [Chitinophagales bacterium]
MKNLSFVIVLLLLSQSIFAQRGIAKKFDITWGPEYKQPKKFTPEGFLYNPNEGYVLVSNKKMKSLTFQRFDLERLRIEDEKEIEIKDLGNKIVLDRMQVFNNKHYLFFTDWDRGRGKEILFVQEVDIKTNGFVGSKKVLIECDKVTGDLINTGMYSFTTANKFKFYFSADSSKMLVTYRKYPESKNDAVNKDVIGFNVFDKNLKKVWGTEIKMPYTEKIMDNEDYQVDSEGNAYLLAKVYDGNRKEEVDGEPNYQFELMKLSEGSSSFKQYPIKMDGIFVYNLSLMEYSPGKLLCAGYYYKSVGGSFKRSSGASGVMIAKMDENLNLTISVSEFPVDILKDFESAREQRKVDRKDKKGDSGSSTLTIRDIIWSSDGSLVINGEDYYFKTHVTGTGTSRRVTYTYYYEDIIAMKIDANNKMAWVNKIPKRQRGNVQWQSMSFECFPINDDYYYFYIDNAKNLRLQPDKTPATHMDGAGGYLTLVKIDGETGELEKDHFFDLKKHKINLYPSRIDQISNNTLIARPYIVGKGD